VRHHARRRARTIRAHAASDPAVTISDFKFGPSSVTIHVGDTVTWTNAGPTAHTATANDHSFDTGVLQKGGSGSHTFTQAGTFAYICSIHPFMHGTIVVIANAAATTPSTAKTTATTTTTTPTTTTPSGPSLPNTGLDLAGTVLFGLGLFGVGLAVRRRAR
jgi:plastocyanin